MSFHWALAIWLSAIVATATTGRAENAKFDLRRAAALGIRKVEGRHLTLYTDLPSSPAVDELPQVFDAAAPIWRQFFGVPPERIANWRMNGFLMRSDAAFRACGMLDPNVPRFRNGFSSGQSLWLYEQPTDYYRRHLLLHEGTHGFMNQILGGAGPPWYMEGTAELLATHAWSEGCLTAPFFPANKEQTPHWARVKIVRDTLDAGRGMTLSGIMNYSARAHLENEPYGWCWAAAAFLSRHPAYRETFFELRGHLKETPAAFNRHFAERLSDRWSQLSLEWQWYAMNLDYGFDVEREAIVFRETTPLSAGAAKIDVEAGRGWQSSGVQLEAGQRCRITAEGRFQIGNSSQPWIAEANGVTLEYHAGQPLGLLLAAVHDASRPPVGLTALCRPHPAGLDTVIQADRGGTLFLQLNDHPSRRHDNAGVATATISLAADPQ